MNTRKRETRKDKRGGGRLAFPLRLSSEVVERLDLIAEAEGLSRNQVIARRIAGLAPEWRTEDAERLNDLRVEMAAAMDVLVEKVKALPRSEGRDEVLLALVDVMSLAGKLGERLNG